MISIVGTPSGSAVHMFGVRCVCVCGSGRPVPRCSAEQETQGKKLRGKNNLYLSHVIRANLKMLYKHASSKNPSHTEMLNFLVNKF